MSPIAATNLASGVLACLSVLMAFAIIALGLSPLCWIPAAGASVLAFAYLIA